MSVLVFTVAQNGYATAFSRCIDSHRRYAKKHGFAYVAVTRPFLVKEPALSAWLKIPLLQQALRAGYDWVGFVDSDATLQESAPDLRSVARAGKTVYMANGRTERLNSGVIFAQRAPESLAFFDDLMASLTEPIPEEDRANLRYENGNVIYCAKRTDTIFTLPQEWNNASSPALADHIRHYTGPLRPEYRMSDLRERIFRWRRRFVSPSTAQPEQRDPSFVAALSELTAKCQSMYPALNRVRR